MLIGKRNAKHDRRVSNLISYVDVFKLLFMLPQSMGYALSWHLEVAAAQRRCGERLAAQVCVELNIYRSYEIFTQTSDIAEIYYV